MKTVFVVLLVNLSLIGGTFLYVTHRNGPEQKHTGEVQLVLVKGPRLWFMRPNKEVFEMFFDNPPAFPQGIQLADVTYTDDSKDERHFVTARLK